MKLLPCSRACAALCCALALSAACSVVACPTDAMPRAAGTLLTVQGAGSTPVPLGLAELAQLPSTTLTQRLSVAPSQGTGTERSITYAGHLLRDLLLHVGLGGPNDRGARAAVIEVVATDGYRALFSWGELFNTAVGDQVLLITQQEGRPLDAVAGPVALRSLADVRPGPRHVRNACAVVVRRPAAG